MLVRLQRPLPVAISLRPARAWRSSSVTVWPRLAAVSAAAMPEAPAPMMIALMKSSFQKSRMFSHAYALIISCPRRLCNGCLPRGR